MICIVCGRKAESEYCFQHKPRKPLQATRGFKRELQERDVSSIQEMQEFFMGVWIKRRHVSEVSGEKLLSPPSSAYFHHILEKEKYPQASLDEENIILLTPDEHTDTHNNMYKFEKINNQRDYLREKYHIFV